MYKPLAVDPTNKHQARLITLLRKIKAESGIDDNTYKYMFTTAACSLTFYGLTKSDKKDTHFGL